MNLDLRIPLGILFTLLGLLLAGYGLGTWHDPQYGRSLAINVNLWWGATLLVFGGLMFFFGWRGRRPRP